MCRKLFLEQWPSQKAKRKALREARGLPPKPGRHYKKSQQKIMFSIAMQEDLGSGAEVRKHFI